MSKEVFLEFLRGYLRNLKEEVGIIDVFVFVGLANVDIEGGVSLDEVLGLCREVAEENLMLREVDVERWVKIWEEWVK
jgi:hypothetical protein